jgi:hypothetical protein
MRKQNQVREQLFLLLWGNLGNFLLGFLLTYFFWEISSNITAQPGKILLKLVSYGIYYYLVTPFVIYWLGYASVTKLTWTKIILTICLVGVYSLIIWDSYFFFKEIMQSLLLAIDKYRF